MQKQILGSRRPSPAMIVAVAALITALAGTAFAGPQQTRVVTKASVKKIAKKVAKRQANRQITRRAPGLSVANAQTAGSAESAATAATALEAEQLATVTVQKEEFTVNFPSEAGATASCPDGQQAIGGGARVVTGDDNAFVTGSRPVKGDSTFHLDDGEGFDGWRGNAIKTSPGNASGVVWAICAG